MGISTIHTNHTVFLGQRHKADYHVARTMEKKIHTKLWYENLLIGTPLGYREG